MNGRVLFGKNQWVFMVAGIFIAIAALAVPISKSNFFDDAYIHARIAENFLNYGEPFFNIGEKFKADSSTGFVFVIALLSIFGNIPDSIRYFEAFLIIATTVSLFYLASLSALHKARNSFVCVAIIPGMLWAAYGGMETPVVCLLIIWAAIAWRFEKHGLVVAMIAMATWFRFEAILLLLIVVFYYAYVRKLFKSIIFYTIPFFILLLVEWIIFGGVIPHAAIAKPVAYGFPLQQSVLNALNALSFGFGYQRAPVGLLFVLVMAVELILILRKKIDINFSEVFLIFSAGIFLAWAVGKSLIFQWYFCLLFFPFGISVLLDDRKLVGPWQKFISSSKVLILLGFAFVGLTGIIFDFGLIGNSPNLRVKRYMDIGTELYSFCPSCTLASSEIGGLGFSYKGKVRDAFGLGDPLAARFHPLRVPEERQGYGIGAIPPDYIAYRNPDFIVSMPIFSVSLRASSIISPYLSYDCPIGANIWGNHIIQVFSMQPFSTHRLSIMGCKPTAKLN